MILPVVDTFPEKPQGKIQTQSKNNNFNQMEGLQERVQIGPERTTHQKDGIRPPSFWVAVAHVRELTVQV